MKKILSSVLIASSIFGFSIAQLAIAENTDTTTTTSTLEQPSVTSITLKQTDGPKISWEEIGY